MFKRMYAFLLSNFHIFVGFFFICFSCVYCSLPQTYAAPECCQILFWVFMCRKEEAMNLGSYRDLNEDQSVYSLKFSEKQETN